MSELLRALRCVECGAPIQKWGETWYHALIPGPSIAEGWYEEYCTFEGWSIVHGMSPDPSQISRATPPPEVVK